MFIQEITIVIIYHSQENDDDKVALSSFWGPTCAPDPIRKFTTVHYDEGDWIYMGLMGAYRVSMLSTFNGFPTAINYYFVKEKYRYFVVMLTLLLFTLLYPFQEKTEPNTLRLTAYLTKAYYRLISYVAIKM